MKRLLNMMLALVLAGAAWAAGNENYTVIVSCDGTMPSASTCRSSTDSPKRASRP